MNKLIHAYTLCVRETGMWEFNLTEQKLVEYFITECISYRNCMVFELLLFDIPFLKAWTNIHLRYCVTRILANVKFGKTARNNSFKVYKFKLCHYIYGCRTLHMSGFLRDV